MLTYVLHSSFHLLSGLLFRIRVLKKKQNENHFVNFTGATFALVTHI